MTLKTNLKFILTSEEWLGCQPVLSVAVVRWDDGQQEEREVL